ncbi:MAG: tetratricopeptide repeat protein [Blastocatellia bacterium]
MKVFIAAIALIVSSSVFAAAQSCVDSAKQVKPILSKETVDLYQGLLRNERTDYVINPDNENRTIWYGRRTAYTGEYKAAIKIFTDGLKSNPKSPKLYRHRGHRYITLRCFDDAIRDFEKAARMVKGKRDEIEPDGLPNAKNIPTSTLQSNIWYHLGLAYYLKGDFKRALNAYNECEKVSKNPDMLVATKHWQYMTLRRLGRMKDAEKSLAGIADNLDVIENGDYYKLVMLYRGKLKADDLLKQIAGEANTLGNASLGYGVGNYFLYNGDKEKAMTIFRQITQGNQWASFGYIASEAELQRQN